VDFGTRDLGTRGIVFFFSFGDVTHFECIYESEGDLEKKIQSKIQHEKLNIALTQSSQVVLTRESDLKK